MHTQQEGGVAGAGAGAVTPVVSSWSRLRGGRLTKKKMQEGGAASAAGGAGTVTPVKSKGA